MSGPRVIRAPFLLVLVLSFLPGAVRAQAGHTGQCPERPQDAGDEEVNALSSPRVPVDLILMLHDEREGSASILVELKQEKENARSVNHALATLLAQEQEAMTSFMFFKTWRFNEDDTQMHVTLYTSRLRSAERGAARPADAAAIKVGRVGLVFEVVNKDPAKPWTPQGVRLTTLGGTTMKNLAVRSTSDSIAPGEAGRVAAVTDLSTLDLKKDDTLAFELLKAGGVRQAYLQVAVKALW